MTTDSNPSPSRRKNPVPVAPSLKRKKTSSSKTKKKESAALPAPEIPVAQPEEKPPVVIDPSPIEVPVIEAVEEVREIKTDLSSSDEIGVAGDCRVVVDRITPSIRGGFALKRILGEKVVVHADVFADGHDSISVLLLHRKQGEESWNASPMRFLQNDLWESEFELKELGYYEYTVSGWVDHFTSWLHGFRKKFESGQDMSVELVIGADLVAETEARASKNDAATLKEWSAMLRDKKLPVQERIDLALSSELSRLVQLYPDYTRATIHEPLSIIVEREKAAFSAWYEFFPRSWSGTPGKHATFKEAANILPEIARMGFDTVYLPPIHPVGHSFRKGKNNTLQAQPDDVGSPWAIGSKFGGHKSIEPELGTMEDFQKFLKKASQSGLEIALDIAFQCSPDHPYVKEHPQWFKWRPDGTVQYAENPPKKYQDVLPFNFETEDWQALWHELKSIFIFWADHGVKIFRVDNPHTKPIEFWAWVIPQVKKIHPDTIFLAEAFTRPKIKYRLGKVGFSQGYTYFTWRNSRDELAAYINELAHTEVREIFRPNFWPNTPDILPEILQHGGRPAFIQRVALAATLSSNFGLYGPAYELCVGEAIQGKEEYFYSEKYELKHWNWDAPGNIKDIIARLNQIRRNNPSLHRTNNVTVVHTDNPSIFAYLKKTPDLSNITLMVVSLDPYHTQSGWINVPTHDLMIPNERSYFVHDQLTDGKYVWRGSRNFVKLEPHVTPVHIFRLHREHKREQDFDYYM